MTKKQLLEIIRSVIEEELNENSPAPAKPEEKPGTEVHPGKPGEKEKPRRGFEPKPGVQPKPKAKANIKEAEMLAQIIKRFKAKKNG